MSDFAALADAFLAAELAAAPTRATHLGAPGHDAELPDLSAAGLSDRAAAEQRWCERFADLDDAALSPDERIDRDLVLAVLRRREIFREWGQLHRDAEAYLDPLLIGLVTLFLNAARPEPELVAAAISRCEGVPDLLAAARENLDPDLAAPLLVTRAVGHARGAVTYLRDWLPRSATAGRDALAAAGARAADAVAEHVEWLTAFGERACGEWAIGEARYTRLLREAEGLGYGAAGLQARGRAAYDELAADLARRARALTGSDDWRGLLDRLIADAPPTPEAMRAEYADWTARARAFCAERELVTLPPGERCEVVPAPPYQRAVTAVAFYYEPPLLARGLVGHFFVPFPPDDAPPKQVRQRLASNSRMDIPTTAVHEAYPGHHWHLAHLAAVCDRPLRKVLESAYFVEGWALYAEQALLAAGFFPDPVAEIGQVTARLFRAARVVVDTALHTGEMTVDEATRFLRERVGLSAETARAEVIRYCAWPTQAAGYLTGALEIGRMREQWLRRGGGLREFHDRLAGSGMLPLGLAERALGVPSAR